MAQVALAWAAAKPQITSLILGASKLEQLQQNLASVAITLPPEQMDELDKASALDPASPYSIFSDQINRSIFGGVTVQGWR